MFLEWVNSQAIYKKKGDDKMTYIESGITFTEKQLNKFKKEMKEEIEFFINNKDNIENIICKTFIDDLYNKGDKALFDNGIWNYKARKKIRNIVELMKINQELKAMATTEEYIVNLLKIMGYSEYVYS